MHKIKSAEILLMLFVLISCISLSQFAFAFTPEQTVMAWVSALKRNEVKAAVLLGTTPEEYLELRKDLADAYTDDIESNASFANDFAYLLAPDAAKRIFDKLQPELPSANIYRDSFAGMADSILDEFSSAGPDSQLTPEQLAAANEVLQAFKGWAMRTDFSDEKRAMAAINTVVSAFRAANVHSATDWAKLSDDARFAKLNLVMQALKGVLKSYDLDVDKLLASISATPGELSADSSEVRIAFKVFEARGSSLFKMYQRAGEWFFWEKSILH